MFNELTKGEIMKNEVNRAIMAKKKIYNQPKTETFDLQGEGLMQGLTNPVSSGGSSSEHPTDIFDGE